MFKTIIKAKLNDTVIRGGKMGDVIFTITKKDIVFTITGLMYGIHESCSQLR